MSAKELNIGDYVRTKDFGINRVAYFDNEEPILENGFTALQSSGYKSSPNIIDLIEVGDLIKLKNLKHYQEVEYIDEKELFLTECIYYDVQKLDNFIEWVITHEQLNEIKYEVK